MAERSTSETDDRSMRDCQNFEHGTVSSDAVYVPHSKQSSRGRRARGKSSGNYRHGQQQNDNLDRSEFDGSKQSGPRGKYSGGRGQKPFGSHTQYYGRRNVRTAAYESRQFPEYGGASFGDSNYNSEYNVADRNASFGDSVDTYNGVHRTRFDETEFTAPSVHVREHVGNSRVPKKAHDDHRYEERSQTRGIDHQPSRRGRRSYGRGRGYRGASNYFSNEKFAQDASLPSNSSSKPVAGSEAFDEAHLRDVTEFSNSDRRNFDSDAEFSRQLKSNSEKLTHKDDKYSVNRSAAASLDSYCLSDELQFRDLHISKQATNLPNKMPNKGNSQSVFSAKIKKTDPEFETQRGNFSLMFSYLFI